MTIEEKLKAKPELLRRVLESAIDNCWSAIECSSRVEMDGDIEWMVLGKGFDNCVDEVSLLTDLGLLGFHPEHPAWVREIATL